MAAQASPYAGVDGAAGVAKEQWPRDAAGVRGEQGGVRESRRVRGRGGQEYERGGERCCECPGWRED